MTLMKQFSTAEIDDINVRTHAAVAAYHAKDSATATRLCSEILSSMPTHPYALNMLAVMTMESGHLEQAIDVFDQLLLAHPNDVQGTSNRQVCEQQLRARGDYWL
jgi:cytochrome c-type biogenesis protein CcmH/NrfG